MQYEDERTTPDSIRQGREEAQLRTPSIAKSTGMEFAKTLTELPRFAYDVGAKLVPLANVLPKFGMNLAKAGADLSFSEMFDTVPQMGKDITQALHTLPARNPLDDQFEIFDIAMQTPYESWTQEGVDFFAGALGYLNPVSDFALVKPAASIVEHGLTGIAKRLPEKAKDFLRTPIKNFGGKLSPKAYGEVGEHLAKSMAIGTAVTIPGAMLDNYNKETDSFNITGAAEQALSNGMLSLGLDGLFIAAGAKFGSHKKVSGKEYESPMPGDTHRQPEFDDALENGEISEEDHKWISDYLSGKRSPSELKKEAIHQLVENGHNINFSNNKVIFNLIKESHYNDFQTAMLDQIASGADGAYKTSLSDYVSASGIDFWKTENAKFVDVLNDYVGFMEKRLAKEPENLNKFEKARREAKFEHIDDAHELSQKNLIKYLKNVGYDVQKLPHAIPKNLRYRATQELKISKLKREVSRLKKITAKDTNVIEKINKLTEELNELKSSKQKLLTPNQELKTLEQHFLSEKGLPENYKGSHEYHRLVDLANASPRAEALLHHVKLKNEYDTQNAYKDFIKYMNTILESNVDKYADPNKVVDYLTNRAEMVGNYPTKEPKVEGDFIDNLKTGRRETSDVETRDKLRSYEERDLNQSEEIMKANQITIDQADDKDLSNLYKESLKRFNQFNENKDTLSQVISCDLNSKGI